MVWVSGKVSSGRILLLLCRQDEPWGFALGDRHSPWWAFGETAWLWKTDGRVIVSAAAHRSKNVSLHSASLRSSCIFVHPSLVA